MGVVHPDMSASKSTIAIVEDDASFRRALERLLCASGFEVHTFASAEEFLGSAVPESHACLILDIRLPGMSGFTLFDQLTALAPGRPSSSPRRTRAACGSKRPGFPTASTCASHLLAAVLLEAVRSLLSRSSSGAERPGT
jgi:CheY-like chemotaxis protein